MWVTPAVGSDADLLAAATEGIIQYTEVEDRYRDAALRSIIDVKREAQELQVQLTAQREENLELRKAFQDSVERRIELERMLMIR